MEKRHCDGCGATEPAGATRPKIQSVNFEVVEDSRFPGGVSKFSAHLCPQCQGMMLYNYFGVKDQGGLEIPAFLEPVKHLTAISS